MNEDRAVVDQDLAAQLIVTTTPPQPAYDVFARAVAVKTDQRRESPEWKARDFKRLAANSLKYLSY
jgi:hypothetical protein